MISQITYQASRAHIEDLRRQAVTQQIATDARRRPDASPAEITEQPHRKLEPLRRVLRGLDSRPAAR